MKIIPSPESPQEDQTLNPAVCIFISGPDNMLEEERPISEMYFDDPAPGNILAQLLGQAIIGRENVEVHKISKCHFSGKMRTEPAPPIWRENTVGILINNAFTKVIVKHIPQVQTYIDRGEIYTYDYACMFVEGCHDEPNRLKFKTACADLIRNLIISYSPETHSCSYIAPDDIFDGIIRDNKPCRL